MDEELIDAEGLTRYYGQRRALADARVQLRRGEVLGLLGPNGAGKSTAMRILSGVLAPNAGSVRITGIDLLAEPRAAKQRIGYLPEEPPLYAELTVDEYLRYCARLHGVTRDGASVNLARVKARCGLDEVGHRLIGSLSKGYRQRVGIAQAIVHQPPVVILDEPTVGLDPIQVREIRALIGELRAEHGVILSTHILPEVQAVCDRVLLIHQGRIVLDSPLRALAEQAQRWRVALKTPPSIDDLRQATGAAQVHELDDGRLLLEGPGLEGETLARIAVEHQWGLTELARHDRSLEEIFVQLTCGDAVMEAAA